MLPFIQVANNAQARASANAAFGAPLARIYPASTFFPSNTAGAPGQPAALRVFPQSQNQTQDPRAGNASFVNIQSGLNISNLLAPRSVTNNIGGASNSATLSSLPSSSWILFGVIGIFLWAIFRG